MKLSRLPRRLLPISWRRKLEYMRMDPKPPLALPRPVRADLIDSSTVSPSDSHPPPEPSRRRRSSTVARPRQYYQTPLRVPASLGSVSVNYEPVYPPVKSFVTPEDDMWTWVKTPPVTVHPLLREGRLIWDVRQAPHTTIINQPPFEIPSPLYLSANVAEQAVLCKGITHVSIQLGQTELRGLRKAWGPITVTAFQENEVLVVDVLRAIYAFFHQKLSTSERPIFFSDPDLAHKLERERTKRCRASGDIQDYHYRRCDLLEGLYEFDKMIFGAISGRECRLEMGLKRKPARKSYSEHASYL